MRLVAVSIVKNEADIIEAFIRHTAAWVDRHLVFDHDSTDGTREILAALQREGLPITLFGDDAPGHLQQARSNHLTRLAAESHDADWILPLDADEILSGPDRAALEAALAATPADAPASLRLHDYCATTADDSTEINPVRRVRHCRPQPSPTRKIFVPRTLALDVAVTAGKGSHALSRNGQPLSDHPLAGHFTLSHFALRSAEHQVLRTIRAELQRLSRGQAAEGLDVHYRLAFQLLTANPARFVAGLAASPTGLMDRPADYRGGDLRHTRVHDWTRLAQALLPYLEQLAVSHGRLADLAGVDVASPGGTGAVIRELAPSDLPVGGDDELESFAGFEGGEGWGPAEGPVPEACLPIFHWGYAPRTVLRITGNGRPVCLAGEIFTYSENQVLRFLLNGAEVASHAFERSHQLERLAVPLPLRIGENELAIHYAAALETDYDTRKLAAIFLRLQVRPGASEP